MCGDFCVLGNADKNKYVFFYRLAEYFAFGTFVYKLLLNQYIVQQLIFFILCRNNYIQENKCFFMSLFLFLVVEM